MARLLLKIMLQIGIGLSAAWSCTGGGLWFLIPWTLCWGLYDYINTQAHSSL